MKNLFKVLNKKTELLDVAAENIIKPSPSYFETLFGFIHDQAKAYLGNNQITISGLSNDSDIYLTNWMSMILIANSDFRIVVKIHYNDSDMQALAKSVLKSDEIKITKKTNVTTSYLEDFAKEFANLLGGSIKRSLDMCQFNNGLSLPLLVRGFDDLFSIPTVMSESYSRRLSDSGKSFIIQLYVEFLTSEAKAKLEQQQLQNPLSGSGEFEFL